MNKKDIILWVSVAGGAYLVYWYLTSNGPSGAVYDAHGNKIAPSYWDSWFGGAAAPAIQQTPAPTQIVGSGAATSTGTSTGTSANTGPATTKPISTTPVTIDKGTMTSPAAQGLYPSIASKILSLAGGDQSTLFNADQWGYYLGQAGYGLTAQQFSQAFPNIVTATDRGPTMTISQYLSTLQSSGVGPTLGLSGFGDIIRTPSISSAPSMSFGGAFGMQKKGWT